MDALIIRPAVADDASALARMLDQLGYPTDAGEIPVRLERMSERPGTSVFVAEDHGKPVGVVTVHLFPSLHTSDPVAWLTALVVDETARGTGVGSALVKRAEEWAARHGARRLALTSHLRRKEAHEFYKRRQYEHTGVRLAKELATHAVHAPRKSDEFHVLEFEHHDDAASFVAALSRFVNSPGHRREEKALLEVWARSPVHRESVKLFLSDGALAAANTAFAPLPSHKTISRQSLPDESFLIIGDNTAAWGADEASARLTQRA